MIPQVQLGQGRRMRGTGENMDGGMTHEALLHRRGREGQGSVLSSHDRNRGSYRRMNNVVKRIFL